MTLTAYLDQASYLPGQHMIFKVDENDLGNPYPSNAVTPIGQAAINSTSPLSANAFSGPYSSQAIINGMTVSLDLGPAPSSSGYIYVYLSSGGYTNANGTFSFTVKPTGTVNVSSNIPSSWTITGPATITGSGTSQSSALQPTGTYTITWGAVSGYVTPASQSLTLASGGTITFSGTYSSSSCTTPWGTTITSGSSVTAYQSSSVTSPATCASETRTCSNGALSGSYTNQSCTVNPAPVNGSCGNANGVAYAYGSTGYSPYAQCGSGSPSTTAFPAAGSSQSWTCSGTNGGSASGTCSASQNAPASCALPWGGTIASGSSVTAYQSSSATSPTLCSSISQTRTCTNGSLSGSYTNQTCTDLTPVNGSCGTANGLTYPNGSTGYSPYTQCKNGTPSTTAFPAAGATQLWDCSGQSGGAKASCSASQAGNPCAATTISGCVLPSTASGSSAGSCNTGYSGTCSYSCANGTWSTNSNACTALPDLTAGNTAVSPASGITNQAESFSGTVSNIGIGTASNFPNIIQVANSAITATIAMLNAGSIASLAPNASAAVSATYTFSSPGSYNIRTCANENTTWTGSIPEANPNNNCGAWQTLTIAYPTLTASCSGTPGNPYTGQAVTWSSSVGSGTGSYSYSWTGTDGLSGTTANVSKVYTTTGQKSATVTVTDTVSGQTVSPSCTTGVNQPNGPTNGGTCTTGVCPGTCTSSLSASPSTVEQGQNVNLSWSVTGNTLCATACTGNGFNTSNQISGTNVPASVPPAPPTTSYGLTCTGGLYGPPYAANTTVTVLTPTVTITANGQTKTARVNPTTANNTTIVWSSANSATCSVTKNGAAWKTGLTGTVTESVTAQTLYKADCVNNYGTHAVGTVLVNLLPQYQKF